MKKIFLNSNMFVSRFPIKPGMTETFMSIWEPLWRNHIDQMEEITNFVFYGWAREENVLVAIESYRDEGELGALRATDYFQQVVGQLIDCCSRPMEMEVFSGLETDRSVFDLYPAGPSQVHPRGSEGRGAVFA